MRWTLSRGSFCEPAAQHTAACRRLNSCSCGGFTGGGNTGGGNGGSSHSVSSPGSFAASTAAWGRKGLCDLYARAPGATGSCSCRAVNTACHSTAVAFSFMNSDGRRRSLSRSTQPHTGSRHNHRSVDAAVSIRHRHHGCKAVSQALIAHRSPHWMTWRNPWPGRPRSGPSLPCLQESTQDLPPPALCHFCNQL